MVHFDPLASSVVPYGTIESVKDHRIRLTDEDLDVINAALRARLAMARGIRARHIERLLHRLDEVRPGNPRWIHEDSAELRQVATRSRTAVTGRASAAVKDVDGPAHAGESTT